MKNVNLFSLRAMGMVLLSTLLLFSCSQIDTFEASDLRADAEEMAANGFDMSPFGDMNTTLKMKDYDGVECGIYCFEEGSGEYVKKSGDAFASWGNGNHTKTLDYIAYNTETKFVIEVDYIRTRPAGSLNGNLSVTFNGNTKTRTIATGVKEIFQWDLPSNWDACDEVKYTIIEDSDLEGDETRKLFIDESYSLFAVCSEGCEDELTVDLQCGETNTAIFTFYAEEAGAIVIQGGLNANAELTGASSNVLTRNTDHPAVINGATSSVTRWEGDVDACEMVTVTVSWTGTASIGNWTAKREDVTLGEVLGDDVTCD